MDSKWLCLRSFIVIISKTIFRNYNFNNFKSFPGAEIAEFFFVDTTPFVNKYFNDMDLALKESAAKWKIVGGHHAIKSAGRHGSTVELTTPPDPSDCKIESTNFSLLNQTRI
uniref:Uncharacterized protein n=1 Tax=Populus trichocarpa TaxID=3694 RepID=A0A2K1R8J6_POPTR